MGVLPWGGGGVVQLRAGQDDCSETQLVQVAKVLTETGGLGWLPCAIAGVLKACTHLCSCSRSEQGWPPGTLLTTLCIRRGGCGGRGRAGGLGDVVHLGQCRMTAARRR